MVLAPGDFSIQPVFFEIIFPIFHLQSGKQKLYKRYFRWTNIKQQFTVFLLANTQFKSEISLHEDLTF